MVLLYLNCIGTLSEILSRSGLPFVLFSQLLLQQLDSFNETFVRPVLITLSVSGHDSEMHTEGDVIVRIRSI